VHDSRTVEPLLVGLALPKRLSNPIRDVDGNLHPAYNVLEQSREFLFAYVRVPARPTTARAVVVHVTVDPVKSSTATVNTYLDPVSPAFGHSCLPEGASIA